MLGEIPKRTVGASMLAMDANDDASLLDEHGAMELIASKLAPTVLPRAPAAASQRLLYFLK